MVKLIVALSGKRKSGKDFLAQRLAEKLRLLTSVTVAGVSHSLKREYAQLHGFDSEQLLTDGPEKEKHRREMIVWGEAKRKHDSGYFCRKALSTSETSEICIITDCRRISDMTFFKDYCKTLTVRIEASLEVRKSRGYNFVAGIDDAESECGLDSYRHDFILQNDGSEILQEEQIEKILIICKAQFEK